MRLELRHRLRQSGNGGGDDLLEATLTLVNTGSEPQTVIVGFATSAQPAARLGQAKVFIPLGATSITRPWATCRTPPTSRPTTPSASAAFCAHYLEPLASDPPIRIPTAPLLAPVLDIYHGGTEHRVSLMTESGQPR